MLAFLILVSMSISFSYPFRIAVINFWNSWCGFLFLTNLYLIEVMIRDPDQSKLVLDAYFLIAFSFSMDYSMTPKISRALFLFLIANSRDSRFSH